MQLPPQQWPAYSGRVSGPWCHRAGNLRSNDQGRSVSEISRSTTTRPSTGKSHAIAPVLSDFRRFARQHKHATRRALVLGQLSTFGYPQRRWKSSSVADSDPCWAKAAIGPADRTRSGRLDLLVSRPDGSFMVVEVGRSNSHGPSQAVFRHFVHGIGKYVADGIAQEGIPGRVPNEAGCDSRQFQKINARTSQADRSIGIGSSDPA